MEVSGTGGSSLDGSPYQGYLYTYPHKTAYRRLDPAPTLQELWADEPVTGLFGYVHVPFCDQRCGYCNLFTTANPREDVVRRFLDQVRREAVTARAALEATGRAVGFADAAVGGGTPTYLDAAGLEHLLDSLELLTGGLPAGFSVEASPSTVAADKLKVLFARGAGRVSIGVQSFVDAEVRQAVRRQHVAEVENALAEIRAAGFGVLNLDLIYGIEGQTPRSWEASLRRAVAWEPEEIFCYPLYVRPLTGLERRTGGRRGVAHGEQAGDPAWDARRMAMYQVAVDFLTAAGYRQESLRMFRRRDLSVVDAPYCCQDDGMVGLGCGARSYTRQLHYSHDYAVELRHVRGVLADYLDADDLGLARFGYRLDGDEQRRRWLVRTLLVADGVDLVAYAARFDGSTPEQDFPQLAELVERGWAQRLPQRFRLTAEGLAHADAIGPWLVSPAVRAAMETSPLR
ncbi:MAG TPA: STM4012 family radical SAM protein [Kineosporiaceae bacterium]|nr:STM4012 family radical SAM protein [Kineosporiaceae bacterium]